MEDTTMNRMAMTGILALGLAAGGAELAARQAGQHQHPTAAQAQQPMAHMQMMMSGMHADAAKLEELLAKMNSATGDAKVQVMAELITALVNERIAMAAHMKAMHAAGSMPMMSMMSGGAMKAMSHDPQPAPAGAVEIVYATSPSPPRMGNNALSVTLKTDKGEPITDATVVVTFVMPAMPKMNMPEMKSAATLKHESAGVYRGTGQITMAGRWEVAVTASRAGKEVAVQKLTITAR
jgi:hypothetical protein